MPRLAPLSGTDLEKDPPDARADRGLHRFFSNSSTREADDAERAALRVQDGPRDLASGLLSPLDWEVARHG